MEGNDLTKQEDAILPYNKMEFISGFAWAVPKAFKDAIIRCWFEAGDTLYDTRKGYDRWDEALKALNYSIQVKYSPSSANSRITIESEKKKFDSVFKANWEKALKIEVTDYKSGQRPKHFSTTQGRLFSFLRYGDLNLLDLNSHPEIPIILIDEARKLLNEVVPSFKSLLTDRMEKPNMFIMPYDQLNDLIVSKFLVVYNRLKMDFEVIKHKLTPQGCNFINYNSFFPTLSFRCLAIDSGSPEKIRDIIKEKLWPTTDSNNSIKAVHDILRKNENSRVSHFKLSEHGLFVPYIIKSDGDKIRTCSFKHDGPIYRYRLTSKRAEKIPKKLSSYLNLLFTDCPNHLFRKSSVRISSECKNCKIDIQLIHTADHELIELAKQSCSFEEYKSRHENLEKFFLENDPYTVACEIPVWIEAREFKDYSKIFNTSRVLTGHIDICRYDNNGKIAIWDYKPRAYEEENAKTQVFLYALMLSVRTGIKLEDFICGYFDETDAFCFNPLEARSFTFEKLEQGHLSPEHR